MDTVRSEAAQRALRETLGASYALERELGRGGMATVYLARDLRHRRAVALKVLHPELSAALGPERFLQEIELTASLQHPHILPLFDSGEAAGLLYYVMPYVDGESLRDRLARERQLGVDEAVRITREVASALDYAHRHGVIHRDVKPENILLHDGAALVADFGIALAVAHASGERITQSGFSLGTPQYMAPEQAMAEREIDARTDIFALGVVLYEMLAGEPPFTGPTAQAVVARVMTDRPRSLAALRETVPSHIEATVMTALAKLPADRFASVAAFAAALAPSGATPSAPVVVPPSRPSRHAPPHMIAAVAAGALAVGAALGWSLASARGRATASSAPAQGPVRFAIDIDSGVLGSSGWWTSAPAISPDGRTIVYAVSGADGLRLYARSLNDVAARPLAGTEDADGPFFSPDGAWVAFGSRGALRKVQVSGGAPITVTAVPSPDQFFSGHWGPGDTIIYSAKPSGALYRVPAGGGTPTRIAVADTSRRLAHPHLLPGGRSLLVTVVGSTWSVGRIGVLELASGRLHQLGPGTGARYAAGHLLYASAGGALYKQAFDLGALTPRANPVEIASGLDVVFAASSAFDVAVNGTLVYRVSAGRSKLTLTDRAGQEQRVLPGSVPWAPQFSPDGRRIAYAASGRGPDPGDVWAADVWPNDVWITDLASGATERITTDGNDNNEPTWTRDGTALAYSSARLPDAKDIFLRTLDGARTRRVVRRPGLQYPSDFAVDGRTLLFDDEPPGGTQDIWLQPLDGAAARPYLATRANEYGAHFSPDGRWVAYVSDETGRSEVYLQAYPIPGRRVVVTTSGGEVPVWKRDGRALYYWQGDQLIVASLGARPGELPAVRNRTTLFRAPLADPSKGYDVTADGSRFAMIIGAPRANRLVVALDALGEVRPAKRTER